MKRLLPSAVAAFAGLLALPARAQDIVLSPLVDLSQPNPVGSCDDGFRLVGPWPLNTAVEPHVAANPVHLNNIVAAWILGPVQNVIAGASFDGGLTWQQVLVPLTVCSGGQLIAAGDPWLSFAPNGDLYLVAIAAVTSLSNRGTYVSKSTDGGLHWSAPVLVSSSTDPVPDHPSLTADPTDAQFVYTIWNRNDDKRLTTVGFTRTTDGGVTWEPESHIVQTNPQSFVQFSQVLVLPNGMLVDVYEFFEQQPNKPITFTNLQLLRSTDRGQTWSAPINAVTMTPLYLPNGDTLVVDPETGQIVKDVTNPSFAIDGSNGNLYAVWEDGRFSNFQYNDIALSMSADGGLTWSAPIRVNQTPLNIPPLNRQAFFPAIAVTADGTIGVSYYDFRFNDPNPGLATDRWLVQCHPSSKNAPSNSSCWGSEVRLTNSSFNMESVINSPFFNNEFFLGDYFGLAASRDAFVVPFSQPGQNNTTSIFARRVGP